MILSRRGPLYTFSIYLIEILLLLIHFTNRTGRIYQKSRPSGRQREQNAEGGRRGAVFSTRALGLILIGMLNFIPFLIFLYVFFRLILPLPFSTLTKTAFSLLLFAASLKQLFFVHIGGDFFSPELPRRLIEGYDWAFALLVLLFAFAAAKDAAAALLAAARWFVPNVPRISPSRGFMAAVIIFCAALSLYGLWEAQRQPEVRGHTAEIEGLPREFDGLRIALLADIHLSASRRAAFAEELVSRVNALSPDVTLIAGDFIDGSVRQREDDVAPLAGLRAPLGVYGVLGNHEYYFGDEEWKEKLETLGIRMLLNEHALIRRGGAVIAIAGLADIASRRFGAETPDVKKALSGVPQGCVVILMDHNPASARQNAAAGAALQLSGHTHGGMMPGLSALVARMNGGFVRGWYDAGAMRLYVSPGSGIWNGFLTRLGVPAEVTVLTLRRR